MEENLIDAILLKNRVTRKFYYGTYPANLIPKIDTFPASLVVNMDNSNLPGSHWVAMFLPNENTCYYFDSFGFEPSNKNITNFLKNFIVVKNEKIFQSFLTENCGYYVIFFIHMCSLGFKPDYIKRKLSSQINPDIFVIDYVNKNL